MCSLLLNGFNCFPTETQGEIAVEDITENFICSKCSYILQEPVQTFCGHLFCLQCVGKTPGILQYTKKKVPKVYCPIDKEEVGFFFDKCRGREINDIVFSCPRSTKGCTYSGNIKSLKLHIETCSYIKKECPTVTCPFKEMGCLFEGKKELVGQHLECKGSDHILLLLEGFSSLKTSHKRLNNQYKEQLKRNQKLKDRVDVLEKNLAQINKENETLKQKQTL